MFRTFQNRCPKLHVLSHILFFPVIQLYTEIIKRPSLLKEITEEAKELKEHQKHIQLPANKKTIKNLTESFNKHASKVGKSDITLLYHRTEDSHFINFKTGKPKFGHIVAHNAHIMQTEDENKYILVANLDKFNNYEKDELDFIVCHELGHLKNNDFQQLKKESRIRAVFNLAVIAGVVSLSPTILASALSAHIACTLYNSTREQDREYRADKTAVTDFGIPAKTAQRALCKIDIKEYLSQYTPKTIKQRFLQRLSSHPPNYKRVDALQPLARQQKHNIPL